MPGTYHFKMERESEDQGERREDVVAQTAALYVQKRDFLLVPAALFFITPLIFCPARPSTSIHQFFLSLFFYFFLFFLSSPFFYRLRAFAPEGCERGREIERERSRNNGTREDGRF